jgi:hypothetical protein
VRYVSVRAARRAALPLDRFQPFGQFLNGDVEFVDAGVRRTRIELVGDAFATAPAYLRKPPFIIEASVEQVVHFEIGTLVSPIVAPLGGV